MLVSRPSFLPNMNGIIIGFSKEIWYSPMNQLLLPHEGMYLSRVYF